MYAVGMGTSKDAVGARIWFSKAAAQGHRESEYNLGVVLHAGIGVVTDEREAADWYRKAAEQGLAQAQADLGTMHFWGIGVERDFARSSALLRKAAAQGNVGAQFNLGCQAWMGGGSKWTGYTGLTLHIVVPGQAIPADYVEARKLFRLAAGQGHVLAQFNAGYMAEKAIGGQRDAAEALKWYRQAAEAGLVVAYNRLATLLEGSDPPDDSAALKLRMKSSSLGVHGSQDFPVLMMQMGRGIPLDYVKLDTGTRATKESVLLLFRPGFAVDPALEHFPAR